MTLRNFGIKSLQELEERLQELGLTLRTAENAESFGIEAATDEEPETIS
jgi:DNA-directed RNA polymerase alpha subunit